MRPGPRNIGIIGLGAGVVAAYGRAGDTMTFYEISPKVIDIERREFTFLRDSPARIEVVVGDGRLSLEKELKRGGPHGYDVLGIDAFSGDSIPMHLVTREAMASYVKHIKPDGVIVFQATNRFIDLLPVIQRLAAEFGLEAVNIADSPVADSGPEYWYSARKTSESGTNYVLADANHWGGPSGSYLIMAPHCKTGPRAPGGSTWQWGNGTETPGNVGAAGGNVGRLDSSVAWGNIKNLRKRYASSYILYYGNW